MAPPPMASPLVSVAAVLAVTSLVLAYTLSSRSVDPRAYPGSTIASLEDTLEHYHIRLPHCADNALTTQCGLVDIRRSRVRSTYDLTRIGNALKPS